MKWKIILLAVFLITGIVFYRHMKPDTLQPVDVFDYSPAPVDPSTPNLSNEVQQIVNNIMQNQGVGNSLGSAASGNHIIKTNSTTNTSYVDIDTGISFNLNRTSNVFIAYSINGNNSGAASGDSGEVCLNIDGVDLDPAITTPGAAIFLIPGIPISGGVLNVSGASSTVQSLAAGSHTLKLRMKATNGGTLSVISGSISYIVLGSS